MVRNWMPHLPESPTGWQAVCVDAHVISAVHVAISLRRIRRLVTIGNQPPECDLNAWRRGLRGGSRPEGGPVVFLRRTGIRVPQDFDRLRAFIGSVEENTVC